MMKKTLLALVTLLMIVSCGQQHTSLPTATVEATATQNIATLTPSQTQNPTETPSPSFTETPSITPTGTLTEWTRTYPTKKALVIYGIADRTEYSHAFIERGYFEFEPFLTLLADGQLIFGVGSSQKQFSQEKATAILAKLEQLGFFQIQDTYAPADPQNPIYSLPTETLPNLNLPAVYITVSNGQESKTIGYMQEWENHLTQPLRDIVSYLNSISSEGAAPYQPDRLLVDIENNELRIPKDAIVIPWPADITPPSQRPYDGVLYLVGNEALKLYNMEQENPNEYFIYDGMKFWVYLRPILPNECHIYHYQFNEMSPNTQPFFSCDDW